MSKLEQIKAPIAKEMELFEGRFHQAMKSRVPLLDRITHYIVKRKGKQIRPMFVFLSAGLSGGISESTYRAASLIELLHTATLVHDDVVDNSYERRGFFSINALWKNKIAVLVGDYLLSRGLLLSVEHKEFTLLQLVSNAVREMSEGELLQIEKARSIGANEETYFQIIRQKTASLIASCCACGAASAGASEADIEKMKQAGEYIGIAFQIKDDLLDFGFGEDIGKPTGVDLKENKLTLPLIYALTQCEASERRSFISSIKSSAKNNSSLEKALKMIKEKGGMEYATLKMQEYRQKAEDIINTFADSDYKKALVALISYTIERSK